MKLKPSTSIPAVLLASLCASHVYGQSLPEQEEGLAAGTQYRLLATDSVAFGPGIKNQTSKNLIFKLTSDSKAKGGTVQEDGGSWSGDLAFDRIDFLKPGEVRMYDVVDGISYSAGIDVKQTQEFDSQSEIVSSRQLGIHYGRLGPENYSSVDLSIRQFSENTSSLAGDDADDKELWSLGVTTGRRFALTGLEAGDPLWTVSLRGQFDTTDSDTLDEALDNHQWYVSPGLQWSGDTFRLTADVLMPFMQAGELEEESDYRVRAKIQKRF